MTLWRVLAVVLVSGCATSPQVYYDGKRWTHGSFPCTCTCVGDNQLACGCEGQEGWIQLAPTGRCP